MPQGGLQWQGTERRSCATGAHWNVQVVRGKVTTRCLWHACKALGIGLLLMLLGACMATIGYYADQLSVAQEVRGNLTIRVKNESRGFHLNNLSYAGPIVMGVGGFIVVAACVMTFEARDSAAKVVPARFRFNQASCKNGKHQRSRRSTSCQTTRWDHQLGLFRVHRSPSPNRQEISRKKLTAELVEFSKTLREKSMGTESIKKSPSAPDLVEKCLGRGKATRHVGCALLNAELLKRHAVSVDYAGFQAQTSGESLEYNKMAESQTSMAMDLHAPHKGGPATLRIQDRSDTAQRHQLLRQRRVDDEESEPRKSFYPPPRSKFEAFPKYPDDFVSRKRSSIDLRLLEELDWRNSSAKEWRKGSSPNFRLASFDRGDRRLERASSSSCHRKSSLDFRKSPDERAFRIRDYRKYSVDKFACGTDQPVALQVDLLELRPRANTAETGRRHRMGKLYHSRSDDNRRRSFDKYSKIEPHSSRFSLNAPPVAETSLSHDYELKYFTTNSLDTEGSHDCSDDSHAVDIEECFVTDAQLPTEADALLEEPELENLAEADVETSGDDLDAPDENEVESPPGE